MRESGEDWLKQLDTVILEIAGLNEIFINTPHFLQLLCKLEGLKITETDFESISLLKEGSRGCGL